MELRDFVKDTLSQLIEGVAEAQKAAAGRQATVNPFDISLESFRDRFSFVEFDVALTSGDSKTTKGGVGVFLGALNLGSAGESSSAITSLSRIKLKIPIELPFQRPPHQRPPHPEGPPSDVS